MKALLIDGRESMRVVGGVSVSLDQAEAAFACAADPAASAKVLIRLAPETIDQPHQPKE
ncbi:MAG: hypothetical protein LBV30_02280 [Propionibacteriaceae bacterium]|jgi:hypothetical protein|nr:hypothetical protein [Propionibacteriaceae bacterium]